ncbi:flagellar filament capping protein FliD [Paenibacillus sp. GXUN7292]|uniref:flagellar filament capping protein FliD n=1 Tax=Paenibacillus sp. GXUN7292 TaxID=3422499 RepID=UPI003D7EE050
MGISITGLASGLDTVQMISDLMKLESIPYKNLETKKSGLQKEQTIFRSINTAFRSLETAINNLKYAGDWNQLKGVSSNTNALKVSTDSKVMQGEYNINVQQLATKNVVQIDADHILAELDANKEVKIGNYKLTAPTGATVKDRLNNLAAQINDNSSAETDSSGAKASVIQISDDKYSLVLNSVNTGSAAENKVNFTVNGDDQIVPENIYVNNTPGKDAKLTINGVEVTRSSNEFDNLVDGATFTLTGTGQSTVSVGVDVDGIVSKVKEFVAAYNKVSELVKDNLKSPEDPKKEFNPLQSDSLLKNISNQLYTIFNTGVVVEGAGNSASGSKIQSFMEQIGLSIDKGVTKAEGMTGKITFDEAAFKNALAEDPKKVINIFTQSADSAKDTTDGIMTKFSAIIGNYTSSVNGLVSKKITGYDSELKMIDERLSNMSRSLEMTEARLKLQFGNMETMLSSLKNEQKWLASQFDALLGTKSNK